MTIRKAGSAAESSPIGSFSESEAKPASARQRVIYLDVSVQRPLPLPNTVSLNSLLEEFEADEAMAQHMSDARQELSTALYSDEPDTLSAVRLAVGLSQVQLAERVGTSQPYIARVEGGRVDPGTSMVVRIAEALGIDAEQAFRAIRNQIATRGQ